MSEMWSLDEKFQEIGSQRYYMKRRVRVPQDTVRPKNQSHLHSVIVYREVIIERNKYSKLWGRYNHLLAPSPSPDIRKDDGQGGAGTGGELAKDNNGGNEGSTAGTDSVP